MTTIRVNDMVIAESSNWIALNKPSGLLSIPDREGKDISLKKILQEKFGQIYVVHRLDRDTSGLILFAKNEETHKILSQQFEDRQTEKFYLGLTLGTISNDHGSIDAPIAEHPVKRGLMVINRKGKESLTDYQLLENFKTHSWVQFRIHTGRTHQVRVHAKHIGHPIACDELYGDGKPIMLSLLKQKFKLSKNEWEEKPLLNRLGLHAHQLSFKTPDGETIELEAPLPKDLRATLQQLSKLKR